MQPIPVIQRVVGILWPSFITAGIATILFFTAFDPDIIFVDYDITRLGAYSIGFFIFWLFGIVTAMLTCFFMRPCNVFNKQGEPVSGKNAD
jgi:hypothetical protein